MKSILVVAVAVGTMSLAATTGANASEALAKSAGCLNCHAADTKKVGPSFKDVAAKYKGDAKAEATLVDKLKSAKGHPAVKASDDDLKAIVKWVVSM